MATQKDDVSHHHFTFSHKHAGAPCTVGLHPAGIDSGVQRYRYTGLMFRRRSKRGRSRAGVQLNQV
jgi:hypothetical protein